MGLHAATTSSIVLCETCEINMYIGVKLTVITKIGILHLELLLFRRNRMQLKRSWLQSEGSSLMPVG